MAILLFHPYSTATENKPARKNGNDAHVIKNDSSIIDSEGTESISIQQYQDRITQIEKKSGVYDSRLGEVLLALGKLYQAQGNHAEAIKAFERALHISKVNKGLYHMGHVELVNQIIDSFSAIENIPEQASYLDYQYWLYRRNFNNDDRRLIPVITRAARWHLEAYNSNPDGKNVAHLIRADDLFDEATQVIDRLQKDKPEDVVRNSYYTAIVNYHIADNVYDKFKMSHKEIREAMIPHKRPTPYVNEIAVRDYYFNQSFYKGRRAIRKILEFYSGNDMPDKINHAKALIYLGDYYMVFKQSWNAMAQYKNAYKYLVENNISEKIVKELLADPVPLKTLHHPYENEPVVDSSATYVDAVISVRKNGWPDNIKVISTNPPADPDLARRGKLAIAGVRYRPRFEHGQAVTADNIEIRYVFRDSNRIVFTEQGENAFFLRDVMNNK